MSQYRDVDVEPGTKVRIALMQDGTLRWTVLRATTCAVTGKEFWQVDRKAVTSSYFDKVISALAGFTHDGPVGQGGCALADAEAVYRRLAREAHPDQGGSHEQMVRLNQAIEAARAEASP